MTIYVGQNIRSLRIRRQVSQEDLAASMGVTVQAISKWETGKANPDIMLLPKLAEYFGVTIDHLFFVNETDHLLSEDSARELDHNADWWAGISEEDLKTTALPNYGFFTPTEETLCLFGDVRGKNVLELGCGRGESLVWMKQRGAAEVWGLDISAEQIRRAERLMADTGTDARLFTSPMEINPGLPQRYFDFVFAIYSIGWSMDLDKTILQISKYLKPGGHLVFAWDNPLMQCISAHDGQYILSRSYVAEQDILISNNDDDFCLHNWKLSTYLNCLADHGFVIERLVEESAYDEKDADVFTEGSFYSAHRARLLNPSFIVKARRS